MNIHQTFTRSLALNLTYILHPATHPTARSSITLSPYLQIKGQKFAKLHRVFQVIQERVEHGSALQPWTLTVSEPGCQVLHPLLMEHVGTRSLKYQTGHTRLWTSFMTTQQTPSRSSVNRWIGRGREGGRDGQMDCRWMDGWVAL